MQVGNIIVHNSDRKADNNSPQNPQKGSTSGRDKIYGSRGLHIGGGLPPGDSPGTWVWNTIDYFSIGIGGTAVDFGDMTQVLKNVATTGDGSRGLIGGGRTQPGPYVDHVQYFNIVTPSNAVDWGGELQAVKGYGTESCDGNRAIFAGGSPSTWPSAPNQLDMFNMQNRASAVDFGEGTGARIFASSCTDACRMLIADQYVEPSGSYGKTIDTLSFTHNSGTASDFGDLREELYEGCFTSNMFRGVHWNGSPNKPYIDYMNIATPANAADFGECVQAAGAGAGSDGSRGVQASQAYTDYPAILYMNIGTLGNTVDYGDLSQGRLASDHVVSGG